MKISRMTVIPVGVGLVLAVVLRLVVLGSGWAIIIGALVAVAVSIALQRDLFGHKPEVDTGLSEDADAALQSSADTVLKFKSDAAGIANPDTREVAARIGEQFSIIVTSLEKPDKKAGAPLVLDQLLEPAHALLTEYLWLTKRAIAVVTDRTSAIERSELPAVEATARATAALLERPGAVDMAALRRASSLPVIVQAKTTPRSGSFKTDRESLVKEADRNP
jgi:hypothetical protein